MGGYVKIKIMQEQQDKLDKGRPVKQPDKLFREPWAEPLSLKGAERYNAINAELENTLLFKVRYCKMMEEMWNFKGFKVLFKDQEYKIYDVDFAKNTKKWVEIRCKAVT